MMGFIGVLAEGAVIEILQFHALSFSHHSYEPSQKILLITHLQFKQNLGTMLVRVMEYKVKKTINGEIDGDSSGSGEIVIKGGEMKTDAVSVTV